MVAHTAQSTLPMKLARYRRWDAGWENQAFLAKNEEFVLLNIPKAALEGPRGIQ